MGPKAGCIDRYYSEQVESFFGISYGDLAGLAGIKSDFCRDDVEALIKQWSELKKEKPFQNNDLAKRGYYFYDNGFLRLTKWPILDDKTTGKNAMKTADEVWRAYYSAYYSEGFRQEADLYHVLRDELHLNVKVKNGDELLALAVKNFEKAKKVECKPEEVAGPCLTIPAQIENLVLYLDRERKYGKELALKVRPPLDEVKDFVKEAELLETLNILLADNKYPWQERLEVLLKFWWSDAKTEEYNKLYSKITQGVPEDVVFDFIAQGSFNLEGAPAGLVTQKLVAYIKAKNTDAVFKYFKAREHIPQTVASALGANCAESDIEWMTGVNGASRYVSELFPKYMAEKYLREGNLEALYKASQLAVRTKGVQLDASFWLRYFDLVLKETPSQSSVQWMDWVLQHTDQYLFSTVVDETEKRRVAVEDFLWAWLKVHGERSHMFTQNGVFRVVGDGLFKRVLAELSSQNIDMSLLYFVADYLENKGALLGGLTTSYLDFVRDYLQRVPSLPKELARRLGESAATIIVKYYGGNNDISQYIKPTLRVYTASCEGKVTDKNCFTDKDAGDYIKMLYNYDQTGRWN